MGLGDLEIMRLYLSDPSGLSEFFSNEVLQQLLDSNDTDVYAATADGWRVKAANVAAWYQVNLDGALLSREQVWEHCIEMSKHFENAGAGQITNILMDSGATSHTEVSEF